MRGFSSSSSPPPNAFLTPAFTAAESTDGSISNSPLNIDLSLLRFTRSRHNPLLFSSSSSSSNDPPDSIFPFVKRRFFSSSSSRRSSTQSPLSPIENLQNLPERSSPSYPVYMNSKKVDLEEDLLIVDALDQSSVNNNLTGANFFIKTDICRSWEERGFCRFGSRCQFAHGKEELRGSARFSKLKPESGKQISAVGSTVYGDKYVQSEPSSDSAPSAPTLICKPASRKMKIIKPEREPPVLPQPPPVFSWPPTEADSVEIDRTLYGPSQTGRRLPVFLQISPTRSNSSKD